MSGNRELAGHFDLQAFRHQAIWNPQKRRIEIYIESRRDQLVPIDALSLRVQFARGERIHTENSHKYTLRGARDMLRAAGFTPLRTWTDDNEWFAVHWAKAS